jgi:prefoldin subunit 5
MAKNTRRKIPTKKRKKKKKEILFKISQGEFYTLKNQKVKNTDYSSNKLIVDLGHMIYIDPRRMTFLLNC